jgi:hypothetical protein
VVQAIERKRGAGTVVDAYAFAVRVVVFFIAMDLTRWRAPAIPTPTRSQPSASPDLSPSRAIASARATIDAPCRPRSGGLTDAIRPLVARTPGVAGAAAIRSYQPRADRRRAHRFGAPHAAALTSRCISGRADRPDQTGWLLKMNSPSQRDHRGKRTGRHQGGRALSADPLEPHQSDILRTLIKSGSQRLSIEPKAENWFSRYPRARL